MKVAQSLDYPDEENAKPLGLLPLDFEGCSDCIVKFLGLLCAHNWAMAPTGQQGCTWLELLAMFCLHGGCAADLGLAADCEAMPRASLRVFLSTFKAHIRSCIQIFMKPADQLFFRPSKLPILRLDKLGFSNHSAAIVGLPVVPLRRAKEIAKYLIGLRHQFIPNSKELLESNMLELRYQRISYRGVPQWKSMDNIFADLNIGEIRTWLQENHVEIVPSFASLFLCCPLCETRKDVRKICLFKAPKWASIMCVNANCRRSTTSRKWKCDCAKLWHSCDMHAIMGHACKTDKRVNHEGAILEPNPNKKQRLVPPPESGKSPFSLTSGSAKRPAQCELVKPITKPGPKILAKFPQIFSTPSTSK